MRTIVMAVLAAAQAGGAAAPLPPTASWSMDYADSQCTLGRRYGDPASPILLVFQPDFFGRSVTAFATGTRSQIGAAAAVEVTLTVPGGTPPIRASGTRRFLANGDRAVLQYVLPAEAFASLAGVPAVTIGTPDGPPVTVALSLASSTLAALRTCQDDLLKRSGYDPVKVARVATPPSGNPGAWFTDRDYPEAARKAKQQGSTFVGMTVTADGVLSDCRVLQSSGAASLDEATCAIIKEHARFRPGLDADGKPIESYRSLRFNWTLPR